MAYVTQEITGIIGIRLLKIKTTLYSSLLLNFGSIILQFS